jgi:Bacterial regulatory helix-turn-helix proteins, AraC family
LHGVSEASAIIPQCVEICLVEANIKKDITLEDLASIASYSAFHFARKFTVAMGIAPHRYISRMRLPAGHVKGRRLDQGGLDHGRSRGCRANGIEFILALRGVHQSWSV